jgi:hypothetical protein
MDLDRAVAAAFGPELPRREGLAAAADVLIRHRWNASGPHVTRERARAVWQAMVEATQRSACSTVQLREVEQCCSVPSGDRA